MASFIIICEAYIYRVVRELVDINSSLETVTFMTHMAAHRVQKVSSMSGLIPTTASLFKLRARRVFLGFFCNLISGPI